MHMQNGPGPGTKDGAGAGDRDQPYRFGQKVTWSNRFPFGPREFVRLYLLRARVRPETTMAEVLDA